MNQIEYEFDPTPRNTNAVKQRLDGQGDEWANQHRRSLPKEFYLQDVDAMFGGVVFGQNTGERLFLEYIPDDYENRTKRIREFFVVSIFDRKTSEQAAFGNHNIVSTAFYLHMCRTYSNAQPYAPRFFFVIGNEEPPWEMIEIDIHDAKETGERVTLYRANWKKVWNRLGLSDLRRDLTAWLQT